MPPPSPPPMPPPSMPWTCSNALAQGKTENLFFRSLPNSQSEWCSIYTGKGNVHKCKRSFVQYNTTPPTFQTCKWNGGSSDGWSCTLDAALSPCENNPPPPPLNPLPPAAPPPPFPPTLCEAVGSVDAHGNPKVSIRDLASPKWCTDLTASGSAACSNAYVRLGNTYLPCIYNPVDATNTFSPTCMMSTTKMPCDLSPPSAPSPPSTPASCPDALAIGFTQDVRYTPAKLGLSDPSTDAWNAKHHVTSAKHPLGHTEYPVCEMYSNYELECKVSYQTASFVTGFYYYPCLFNNKSTGGGKWSATCRPSPTARTCTHI